MKKGQVNHWNLAAYSAELWAVIVACTDATRPIQLFSECLAVVEQASTVFCRWDPFMQVGLARSGGPFCTDWLNCGGRFARFLLASSGSLHTVLMIYQNT